MDCDVNSKANIERCLGGTSGRGVRTINSFSVGFGTVEVILRHSSTDVRLNIYAYDPIRKLGWRYRPEGHKAKGGLGCID